MTSTSEILTVEEAATLLSLSESAAYKLLQQGDLPGAKIGGQWRLRRSDLERSFDLARARARAAQLEKEAPRTWASSLEKLQADNPGEEYVLTRCLWCSDWVPAWSGCRYTTFCSGDCVAEARRAFDTLGWRLNNDHTLSPIYRVAVGDGTELWLGNPYGVLAEIHGMVPDHELTSVRYEARHSRGPLREWLLLEHPYMRDYNGRADSKPQAEAPGQSWPQGDEATKPTEAAIRED